MPRMCAVAVGVSSGVAQPARTEAKEQKSSGVCGRGAMTARGQWLGDRGQGQLIVLPSVWAVAEKKPCGSERSMVQARAFGTGNANTGVSPLRFAPVEMTTSEKKETEAEHKLRVSPLRGSAAPVEMTNVNKIGLAPSVEMTGVRNEKAAVVELAFYRKYTEAMLRRYAVLSMEAGRVPSMLGREMFRGKVTSYRVHGFDDAVIFCHDVESCLRRLPAEEQKVIKRVAVQQYTHSEAAMMLGLSLRTCIRHYGDAVDRLTRIFLKVKLLEPLKACQ